MGRWAGEWKATAEGTWEKVRTHRRDKEPLLGRVEVKESERRRVLAYNNGGGGFPGEPLSQDGIFWSVPRNHKEIP